MAQKKVKNNIFFSRLIKGNEEAQNGENSKYTRCMNISIAFTMNFFIHKIFLNSGFPYYHHVKLKEREL